MKMGIQSRQTGKNSAALNPVYVSAAHQFILACFAGKGNRPDGKRQEMIITEANSFTAKRVSYQDNGTKLYTELITYQILIVIEKNAF
jgi:hypothetical protein